MKNHEKRSIYVGFEPGSYRTDAASNANQCANQAPKFEILPTQANLLIYNIENFSNRQSRVLTI